ncbi:hypothetical protein V8E53_015887 [Lactarius tabidus]
MDTRAMVRDIHTEEEFEHNIRDLNVCSTRGRVVLGTNFSSSLVGRRVQVCQGPLKGYRATVTDVRNCGVTIKVDARLVSADVQAVLERRCVPLNVSGVRGGVFDQYEGKTVRTMPIARHRLGLTPNSGELIVNTVKGGRIKQLSINAGFLKPWEPVPNGEVVVIEGPLCGTVGTVQSITEHICTIRFEESGGASTYYFKPEKVAYLEPLGNS